MGFCSAWVPFEDGGAGNVISPGAEELPRATWEAGRRCFSKDLGVGRF